jgi:hypothetical protein
MREARFIYSRGPAALLTPGRFMPGRSRWTSEDEVDSVQGVLRLLLSRKT